MNMPPNIQLPPWQPCRSRRSNGRRSNVRFLPLLVLALGCSAKNPGAGTGADAGGMVPGGGMDADTSPPAPFEPLPPAVYGTKVKDLLVGQPLTADELTALLAEPTAIAGLIDKWMAQPQWRVRMFGFFQQAFQQTQTSAADFDDQLGLKTTNWNALDQVRFNQSAEESFARTALQLLDEGRPFNEVITTRRLMLNPPLMAALAFMDAAPQDDDGNALPKSWWLLKQFPALKFTRQSDTPIPLTDSIDPASPNFMTWYDPTPYSGANAAGCMAPVTYNGARAIVEVVSLLFGGRPGCGKTVSQFADDDWTNWKMVTVRAPRTADEARTIFWNVPQLRTATELVLATPRVGFMTTPAFFANWPTNTSNQARVTVNQTMIVGLGVSFDDRGTTVQVSESSSDAMHVTPGTPCYGCHQTLDPMRDFFRQSYDDVYSQQLDPVKAGVPPAGTFTVDGSAPITGAGIGALADAMATHPRFAVAWTQKLCRLANSASCSEDDPEFIRIANAFKASGFDFKKLVRDLFSSPLVTFASTTKTATDSGIVIGIARRETLCASLESRFGITDVCGIHGFYKATAANKPKITAANLAGAIPGDGYARGSETPLMPHDSSLFSVSATENLCDLLAAQLVDVGASSRYTSGAKDAAIADFVGNVMGLPANDGRAAPMTDLLNKHYGDAMAAGETAGDALRSTFVLACSSPLAISLGL
ncbi:MAG: hypothetical protein QOI66_2192 [Myxococcales bacterium]|jgi:hypothetical protein|nr:hypothetical protein [Myxococcales bacterium]